MWAPRAVCLAPCICLRTGWSSWRGEGRLYEGGREGAGGRRGEGEECGGEEGGRGKKREQEKWKKLQEGPLWVGFSPKVLPPEKAILVSRSVRLAASLSRLPKKVILASDERLERAVSGDVQKGGPREQVEGFRRSWKECGEMRVTCESRIELTDGKRDDEELLKVGGNGMVGRDLSHSIEPVGWSCVLHHWE